VGIEQGVMVMSKKTSKAGWFVGAATLIALAVLITAALAAPPAEAAVGPYFAVKTTWGDTNLTPGGDGQFEVLVRNVGEEAAAEEELTITDELPPGVTVTNIHWEGGFADLSFLCSGVGTEIATCGIPSAFAFIVPALAPAPGSIGTGGLGATAPEPSGHLPLMFIDVAVDSEAAGTGTNTTTVSGGGAPLARDVDQVPFGEPSKFGLVPGAFEADVFDHAFPFGSPARQAGGRPFEQRVNFDLTARTGISEEDGTRYITPTGAVKTVEVTLPRGFIGNPEALPKCNPADFAETGALGGVGISTACPPDTQVGYLNVPIKEGTTEEGRGVWLDPNGTLERVALYNLVPPKGQVADLAFNAGGFVQAHIYPTLDPAQNYSIKTVSPNISSILQVRGTEVTVWGVPGDPAHDKFRYYDKRQPGNVVIGAPWGSAPIRPFLTNPMDCGFDNGGARIRIDSYQRPGAFGSVEAYEHPLNVAGCDDPRFRFEPDIALQPTDAHAGAPTGLDVHLKVPQRNDEVEEAKELYAEEGFVKGISTPPLKKAVVTFPKGMTVNPAAAQGLGSCTPQQIGLGTDEPVTCPDNSQFGTLTLHTPILPVDAQPKGFVYIAKQNDNPFHNFLSLYLVIQEPDRGILVKVPGRVDLDPNTGQITTTFDDLPQFPLSDMQMTLKGGLRAGLVNPQTCGEKTIEATFYSWQDPSTPHTVKSSYEVTQNPDGTPCFEKLSERPFDPSFRGGTANPLAGAFSPMELDFARADIDQELLSADGTAPPGLIASLRGIGRCTDAQIAAAADLARSGTEELEHPSCPASAQVGTVDAGAGVGQVLTYVKGKVYLAGPYEGAPASGVAIVPAVAGPFDLGVVVTRAPAYIDPVTAQLSIKTDPLPQIFKGVPVRVRDVRVHLDRPSFTLNPTSCEEMHLGATVHSSEGKSKGASSRFQVGSCAELGFKPRLVLRLKGGTERGAHPSFSAVFRPRRGDANTARIQVTLPHSAFLDQAHIRTICTHVQFSAGEGHGSQCPAGSIYGHVRAFTPLLDEPLEGPVFLRSSNHNLPDLVAAVSGPPSLPIHFESAARIDSIHGGIRSTFAFFPDVPLEKAVLTMQGAKKGLIVNSTNLCAGTHRALADLAAHNGRRYRFGPVLRATKCGKAHRRKHPAHRHATGKRHPGER
jgi:uncharacterized repeat protein (TIGR01451 family)